MCTMDSGRTWTSRPMMVGTIDNTDKKIISPQGGADIALAPDGTIYDDVPPEYWPATIPARTLPATAPEQSLAVTQLAATQ